MNRAAVHVAETWYAAPANAAMLQLARLGLAAERPNRNGPPRRCSLVADALRSACMFTDTQIAPLVTTLRDAGANDKAAIAARKIGKEVSVFLLPRRDNAKTARDAEAFVRAMRQALAKYDALSVSADVALTNGASVKHRRGLFGRSLRAPDYPIGLDALTRWRDDAERIVRMCEAIARRSKPPRGARKSGAHWMLRNCVRHWRDATGQLPVTTASGGASSSPLYLQIDALLIEAGAREEQRRGVNTEAFRRAVAEEKHPLSRLAHRNRWANRGGDPAPPT